ncbi:MAG: GH25 family lysozyme [Myxococcales bacterium]
MGLRPVAIGMWGLVLSVVGCADVPEHHVGVQEQAIHTVCPGPEHTEGIDVSYYQGTIDWAKVAGAGKVFTFVRSSAGATYRDSAFAKNWSGAKAAGLLRGAYHYFHADVSGTTQADLMASVLGTDLGELAPVVDVEETKAQTAAAIGIQVRAFVDRIAQKTGRVPMIYTGGYFWDASVKSSDFATLPVWVAHYFNDNTTGHCPNTPNAWARWQFWQYSGSGTVAGITGAVDLDIFDGTRDQLLALGQGDAGTSDASTSGDTGSDGAAPEGAVDAWVGDTRAADVAENPSVDGGTTTSGIGGCQVTCWRGGAWPQWLVVLGCLGLLRVRRPRVILTAR